jgi:3-oxoacyl-[acyl-carrier-protein] synthase II
VANTARDLRMRAAMSNSFGFGGHNACIVLKHFD